MYTIVILLVLSLVVLKAWNSRLRKRKALSVESPPMDDKLKQEIQRLKKIELQKMQDDARLHSYMRLDMKRTLNNVEFKEYMRLLQEIKESVGL